MDILQERVIHRDILLQRMVNLEVRAKKRFMAKDSWHIRDYFTIRKFPLKQQTDIVSHHHLSKPLIITHKSEYFSHLARPK